MVRLLILSNFLSKELNKNGSTFNLTMRQLLLMAILWLAITFTGYAQTLPNASFETWTTSQSGLYEQPSGNYWTSLNPLRDLGGPVTVEKVTDACEGTYAAKLTTKNFTSLLVSGLLASGTFNQSNLLNPLLFGQPFTIRPTNFTGCFKFSPVSGDSCALVAWASKWNPQTNQRDTVGTATLIVDTAVADYTTYNIPFNYLTQDTPDTLTLVFSSSADGQNNNGQEGTALWVDNVAIDIANGISLPMMGEAIVKCYPNPFADKLTIEITNFKGEATFTLISAEGKFLGIQKLEGERTQLSMSILPCGNYSYIISSNGKTIYWGTLTNGQ